MSGFLSDEAVIDRVLGHIAAGTTDRGDVVWREPVDHYLSEERFEREVTEVLRRTPTAFCPSAALPEPGSYIARVSAGVPLLVVRGRDGRVRAFKNACRHRGAQIAEGSGCAKAFVCPYHGWAYHLDGRLQTVTHADGLPDLDVSSHGLEPLHAEERHGLVFVSSDPDARPVPGTDALPELVAPEQQLIDHSENVVEANWKVFLEGSLEGYHIRFAHEETFYPYGFDNLTLLETCGAHSRITFPFRRIEKLAQLPPEERSIDGRVTYVYHLFPNVLVTVLSRHTNVIVIEPIDPGRTRTFTYRLTNRGEGAGDAEDAKRDASFVNDTGATEDRDLVTSIQKSIESGANEFFTFGHYESLITHFHRTLTERLSSFETGDA